MQSLRVKRFEKYNLNEGREMFLFMSKTNGNDFINLQCISIRIKHLFWGGGGGGGGHIKLYYMYCSRAMMNYSIITGDPRRRK